MPKIRELRPMKFRLKMMSLMIAVIKKEIIGYFISKGFGVKFFRVIVTAIMKKEIHKNQTAHSYIAWHKIKNYKMQGAEAKVKENKTQKE